MPAPKSNKPAVPATTAVKTATKVAAKTTTEAVVKPALKVKPVSVSKSLAAPEVTTAADDAAKKKPIRVPKVVMLPATKPAAKAAAPAKTVVAVAAAKVKPAGAKRGPKPKGSISTEINLDDLIEIEEDPVEEVPVQLSPPARRSSRCA